MTQTTQSPLITYLGQPELKAAFLGQLAEHERLDAFIQGTYGDPDDTSFRGCGIGCSLHSLNLLQGIPDAATDDHANMADRIGWPVWLAYLEDNIFESLPLASAKQWPRRVAAAIPVGVTVPDRLLAKILRWTLGDATYGCRYAVTDPAVVAVVDRMIALFDREIRGDSPTPAEWSEATRAAWDAWDAWDAWAAGDAGDAWAAWAAWAAGDAGAAWAAGDAGAARTARAAGAAGDAGAAWAARDAGDGFYPALAAYVLQELAALEQAGS